MRVIARNWEWKEFIGDFLKDNIAITIVYMN